jgi:hypothetical protein
MFLVNNWDFGITFSGPHRTLVQHVVFWYFLVYFETFLAKKVRDYNFIFLFFLFIFVKIHAFLLHLENWIFVMGITGSFKNDVKWVKAEYTRRDNSFTEKREALIIFVS